MPAPHPPHLVETARRLRREGKSGPHISRELGIPARTVHDWLKGQGESAYLRTCLTCRERFFAARDANYCSKTHYMKHYNALGALRDRRGGQ